MSAGGQINWDSIAPRADAGAVNWDSIAPRANPSPETSHVQGHPLKGQNFGDWLTEELLAPVVNAATQLGRGMQGLGHPEQRPLTESVKDVVQGGSQIVAPFAAAGLNSEPAPAGPASAGAPSAVGTALKGAAKGALKAVPKAAETSILKYTGIPQITRGAITGAKEALKARAETIAPPAEAPTPPPAAAPTEDEQLLAAIQRGQSRDITAENVPQPKPARGLEHYGVKAAEVPPQPAPSAPAPTPASAAATPAPASAAPSAKVQPIRPEPPAQAPTPEQVKTSGRTFVKDARPSSEDYTLVQVPTAKLDAGWAKEGPAFYIPPGGGGAEIGGRLQGAKDFIQTGQPIEAPRVSMAEDGRIAFEDGRHRFSALRDAGDKTTAVMVPNEQVADFQTLNKAPATASKAPTAATTAKSARYADAIGKWARDHGMSVKQIADQWENASPEAKGQIYIELQRQGYLGANETIPKTSAQGIVDALKAKAATIKPPAGFSMGSMKQ